MSLGPARISPPDTLKAPDSHDRIGGNDAALDELLNDCVPQFGIVRDILHQIRCGGIQERSNLEFVDVLPVFQTVGLNVGWYTGSKFEIQYSAGWPAKREIAGARRLREAPR